MSHYSDLWVEKYRPKTLSEIVVSDDIKKTLQGFVDDIPHILFYGPAGTGKTTTAKVLITDVLKCQYLYINASDESGIDTIRNKVINFSQTRSIDGKRKVILLDECDGLSGSAMRILRNVMEEFSETTRFILTANYFNRIIEPIRSRCVLITLKSDLKDCMRRCLHILKTENVDIGDNLPLLVGFVKDRLPDMRRIINDLQKSSVSGKLNLFTSDDTSGFVERLLEDLKNQKNIFDIRKTIIESENEFDSDFQGLYKNLFESVFNLKIKESLKKELLLAIGEFSYRDNFVVDHEINFFSFLLEADRIFAQ